MVTAGNIVESQSSYAPYLWASSIVLMSCSHLARGSDGSRPNGCGPVIDAHCRRWLRQYFPSSSGSCPGKLPCWAFDYCAPPSWDSHMRRMPTCSARCIMAAARFPDSCGTSCWSQFGADAGSNSILPCCHSWLCCRRTMASPRERSTLFSDWRLNEVLMGPVKFSQ